MKKAKFVLTAIGMLSVIGGIFAFKAQHRILTTHLCSTKFTSNGSECNLAYTTARKNFNVWCTTVLEAAPYCYVPTRGTQTF